MCAPGESWAQGMRVAEEQELSSMARAQLESLTGEGPAHVQGTASLRWFWSLYAEHSLLRSFAFIRQL